jgi:hypothetical protein
MSLQPLQQVHEEKAEDTQRDHRSRVTYPGLLFPLADAAEFIDQAFQRAENRMEEGPLSFKNTMHKDANGFRYGDNNGEKDHDLRNTE